MSAFALVARRCGRRIPGRDAGVRAAFLTTCRGLNITDVALRLTKACVSRAGVARKQHDFDGDGRCFFCSFLLPEGFAECPCGCGTLMQRRVSDRHSTQGACGPEREPQSADAAAAATTDRGIESGGVR